MEEVSSCRFEVCKEVRPGLCSRKEGNAVYRKGPKQYNAKAIVKMPCKWKETQQQLHKSKTLEREN